ncbi:MAG: hypothetical protein HKO65_18130 [Gemmatimonadetes bacterium]|nr:hypothetical protein [Gemmatimonadota bacterium]
MMLRVISALGLASVMTLAPLLASAQVNPPPGGQRQRMQMEQRLQQGFQRSIQNQLGWDQARMEGLRGIMRSFQEERSALNRAQASVRYRLRDPALQDLTDQEAAEILQEMLEVQQQELELYRREQQELLTIMSAPELVRFYRLRDNLGQRLQQLRQGRGTGGGRGGGVGLASRPGVGRAGNRILR